MTKDDLEFSIAQYADGSLSEAERAALEAVLAGNDDARALLAEYRALDTALKDLPGGKAVPAPEVRWDALAERISDAVAQHGETVISVDDEFLLAQFADATLAEADRPAVEARLNSDPAARLLVAEYQAIDGLLRPSPLPDVTWNVLAAHISAAVARGATDNVANDGITEDQEYAVAQYADGTLAASERGPVEAQLASDPRARIMLADYAAVDDALKDLTRSAPLPAVRWEALSAHLSAAIAVAAGDVSASAAAPDAKAAAAGAGEAAADAKQAATEADRSRRFRLFSFRSMPAPAWMALAASVLVAFGVGIRLIWPPSADVTSSLVEVAVGPAHPAPAIAGSPVVVVRLLGPQGADTIAPTPSALQVAIGPASADAGAANRAWASRGLNDDFVSRQRRVIIATAVGDEPSPAGEGTFLPF